MAERLQTYELDARGATRRAWWQRAALPLVAGVLVAVNLLGPDGLVSEITYLGVIGGAGVVALVGARRKERPTRAAWGWIAAGVCLSALGEILYSVYVHVRHVEPDVSIADLPWLASYVAISVGLLMLLRAARERDRGDVDGLIDMAVVGVVSLLIVWQVSVQATLADASVAPGVRAVWASYPILDAALLALVVRAAMNRRMQSSAMLLLAGGVGCWLFSDFFYTLYSSSTSWATWLDAGWMGGAVLLAAATSVRAPRQPVPDVRPVNERVGVGRIAFAIAPLLIPGVIEVVAYTKGYVPDPVPMLVASVAMAALAFARALRLLRTSQRAEAELRATEQQFRALVQNSSDAALLLDPNGIIGYVSPTTTVQLGYQPEELLGRVGWDLLHPDDLQRAIEAFIDVAPGAHATAEVRVKVATGEWRWVEEAVSNLLDDPAVAALVVNIRDISERKAAEQELSRMAHYDDLTGLPNRWLVTDELEQLLADGSRVALLTFDLDHFKFVNQSRGRETGDLLLQAVADRLIAVLPEGDTLGRLEGDEFAVICHDVPDWATAWDRAARVHHALANPFEVVGRGRFHVTAGVGIALARADETPEQILQDADTAMHTAKSHGPDESVAYDEKLRREADERLTIEHDLRRALRSDELIVHYQPVIDVATGAIDGVEALVRWRHPTRGLLLPGAFIPIAEQSSLIDGIGALVLHQACADAAYWSWSGCPLPVAVNISAAQLCHAHITETIQSTLADTGLAPELLILEVTETALLVGAELALANVEAFRALGVRVALDDFGTGYSSLAYLKAVPADIVKIDRSFVSGVADSTVDRDIVGAIIDLSRALDRVVVAEGVETEAQLAELSRLGCPFAQGFLWSPAVPAAQILTRLQAARKPVPAA